MIPQRIIWHHSADSTESAQFDKINRYHAKRDFPKSSLGYYVGYHYLIENDGATKKARSENEIGAHDTGENPNSLGICFAGDFNRYTPTEAQIASAVRLIKDIRERWPIPLTRIEPHRWDDDTDCPGLLLPDNWLINEYLKREGNLFLRYFQYIGELFNLL